MSFEKDFANERPSGDFSVASLMLKVRNLEKSHESLKIKQEELEKTLKTNSSMTNLDLKLSENDSTRNTNDYNDLKSEMRTSKRNDSDLLTTLKNSITDLYSLIDSKHSDVAKRLDEHSFKHNTKYSQVTERMNMFYSNISKEFELFSNEINKRVDNKNNETKTQEAVERESIKNNNIIKELRDKYNSLEASLKDSTIETQTAYKRLVASLDKTLNNMSHIKTFAEEKIDDINIRLDNESSKFIKELEVLDGLNKKYCSKIEKGLESKQQEGMKVITTKFNEMSKTFVKAADLDKVFEGQSFANGIGEIVSQLNNVNVELNKSFNKTSEYDQLFQNIGVEIKKIKESHNLLVDNYEKKCSSIDSKLEDIGIKSIKSQTKQYEDFMKKKEIFEKQSKEEKSVLKENNEIKDNALELRIKQCEDYIKVLEKTIRSVQNLQELNMNSLNLKFDEFEVKLQKESMKTSKIVKEYREKYEEEISEFTSKYNNIEKYITILNKNLEENKTFELKLFENYQNLQEKQKDQELLIFNELSNEVTLLNSIKQRARSSTNIHEHSQLNIKNIVLMIENHALQRYNQLKSQICNMKSENAIEKDKLYEIFTQKLKEIEKSVADFNIRFSGIENETSKLQNIQLKVSKELFETEIQRLHESIQNTSDKLELNDTARNDIIGKLNENSENIVNLSADFKKHIQSIWDTITLINNS